MPRLGFLLAIFSLFAAGCSRDVQVAPIARDSRAAQAVSTYKRVFESSGNEKRPKYIPSTDRQIDYVEVGPSRSLSIGHAVDGGAWKMVKHQGGLIGFADGTKAEVETLTLVYDNYTEKLVAIEVP